MLPTKSLGLLAQVKKRNIAAKISKFLIGMVLAISDLQVTATLPTKLEVNWSFGLGEAKNRFSRWSLWISDRNNFSHF